MKILRIRLKNLNSLRGEWIIDLTDKAYSANGIFAVTGPTGAGKTTIFDAVCLALYGRTPRLPSISENTNEIMSRGTGQCFAHVTFRTDSGEYTAKWEQHRAGKNGLKASGKLQAPDHKLERYEPGKTEGIPITSKNTETRKAIERITGMDFMRFTRAMMLEQGGFDVFLSSDKNDRAAVLELITGTDIYSDISRRVYRRSQKEKETLKTKTTALQILRQTFGETDEEALKSELEQGSAKLAQLQAEHSQTDAERSLLREIRNLESNLANIDGNISTQKKRLEIFEADRRKMEAAERASHLTTDYTALSAARTARDRLKNEHASLTEGISQYEAAITRIMKDIPALTEELASRKGSTGDGADVAVVRVQTAVKDYEQAVQDKARCEEDLRRAESALRQAQAVSLKVKEAGKLARARMNEADAKHKAAYDEILASRARTAEAVLSQERAKLKQGEACPLCGSREHPGIEHLTSSGENADELFRRTEHLEAELAKLRKEAETARNNFDRAVENWNGAFAAQSAAEKQVTMSNEALSEKSAALASFRQAVSDAIRPLGLTGATSTKEILRLADEWAAKIKAMEDRLDAMEKEQSRLATLKEAALAALKRTDTELSDTEFELEHAEASFADKLKDEGFTSEAEFAEAWRFVNELPGLRMRWQELTTAMQSLTLNRDSTAKSLKEKQSAVRTQATLDETEALFRQQNSAIIALSGEIAGLSQKIDNVRTQKAQAEELANECEAQKEIAGRWDELSGYIGSAEGDKFRIFAQQITLALVVRNANDYLTKMNGRYTLKLKDNSDKLELDVIDREQAGEVRPTENLSGGERFLVSLALALGLSQISGSRARVDSLFLDEGFGSLDEDSLNTALEALGEIRREGRMIGIISHVAALRERIAARINVIPKHEGTSILEGPGCSRM